MDEDVALARRLQREEDDAATAAMIASGAVSGGGDRCRSRNQQRMLLFECVRNVFEDRGVARVFLSGCAP